MDAPIEIGPHVLREWSAGGEQFRLALHSQAADDVVMRFQRMCEAVVLEEEGVFGAFPKYDNGAYTFLVDYLPYVSGDGMEHRNSSVITSALPLTRQSASQQIESVAHEFFHSWNVKRIRPRSLEPFDYERVNMSGELWFAEGFTDYYGPLVLKRAGLMSRDEFLALMREAVNAVLTAPGREVFSPVDMSRRAAFVDGATSIDPQNQANIYISYYTYGRAVALGIDLAIRSRFPGKSLDDWMRAMWRRHPDVQKPYTEQDLEQALAEATGSSEFAKDIFERHIDGLEPMDYAALLARAGFVLQPASPGKAWIGTAAMSFSDRGIDIVGSTLRGSPLYIAGIDRGDRIVDADGKNLKTRRDWDDLAASHKPGDRSTLTMYGGGCAPGRKQSRDHLGAGAGRRNRFVRKGGTSGDAGNHGVPRCVAGFESAAALAEDRHTMRSMRRLILVLIPAAVHGASRQAPCQRQADHPRRAERRSLLGSRRKAADLPGDARYQRVRSAVHHERRRVGHAHGLDRQGRHHLRLLPARQQAHHLRVDARSGAVLPGSSGSQQGLRVGGLPRLRYLPGRRQRQDRKEAHRYGRLRCRGDHQLEDQQDHLYLHGVGRPGSVDHEPGRFRQEADHQDRRLRRRRGLFARWIEDGMARVSIRILPTRPRLTAIF